MTYRFTSEYLYIYIYIYIYIYSEMPQKFWFAFSYASSHCRLHSSAHRMPFPLPWHTSRTQGNSGPFESARFERCPMQQSGRAQGMEANSANLVRNQCQGCSEARRPSCPAPRFSHHSHGKHVKNKIATLGTSMK
jgi:hypothetical protein